MERDEQGKFAPGNSGGPGRPPKENCLTDVLRSKLDPDEMADLMIEKARAGDSIILKYLYDRIDGKPVETVNSNVQQAPTRIDLVRHTADETDRSDSGSVGEQEEV